MILKNLQSEKAKSVAGLPYKVIVVDDSAIIRGFICRYLSEDPAIEVVTTANNGEVALRLLKDNPDVEVVVLDIEMPVMDGLTALPKMLELRPDLQVVMASTLTKRNAEVSLRALKYGAVDCVPKPETARSVNASIDFRREIVEKVKAWALRQRRKKNIAPPTEIADKQGSPAFVKPETPRPSKGFVRPERSLAARSASMNGGENVAIPVQQSALNISLRPSGKSRPKIIAIGSSTGGPQALMRFFKGFSKEPSVPVVVTQHMPATFTAILATHLSEATGWECREAKDGDILTSGKVFVAPGDYHMAFEMLKGDVVIRLNQGPQENFCRPAVDPMYRSLIDIYGENVLGVILTGMGHDGLKGSRDIVKSGGTIFAQDEQSSVVWGMPGAVATAGLCSRVLPIDELGKQAEKKLDGGF